MIKDKIAAIQTTAEVKAEFNRLKTRIESARADGCRVTDQEALIWLLANHKAVK